MIKLIGKVDNVTKDVVKVRGVSYSEATLQVKRESGVIDNITLYYNSDLDIEPNTYIKVFGEVRTYKETSGPYKTRLKVYVNHKENVNYDELSDSDKTCNYVCDEGFVVTASKMRTTPNKKRITDIRIGKISAGKKYHTYMAIAWELNAKKLSNVPYGTKIKLEGRLQERKYMKEINGEKVERSVLEVSIFKADLI